MDTAAKITLLFDTFSEQSQNLYNSFRLADRKFQAVVIEDDGFLPEGILSVYGGLAGYDDIKRTEDKRPLYFNQIAVPKYWQIEGNNTSARVLNHEKEVARIFYADPKQKRLVRVVDWLDDQGVVRLSEHYNKYGEIYCHTIFNKKGQKVARKFFSPQGEEKVVENFVTNDFIVSWEGKEIVLHTKTELICFYLRCKGLEQSTIYYNSLSTPFFAAEELPENGYQDILFWNEPIGEEIPGNMQYILQQHAKRCKQIYVQRQDAFDKLMTLGASEKMVKKLGYVYDFVRENNHKAKALICTNSDRIAHINDIVQQVPQMHFSIAAFTEMSSKLMSLGDCPNVSLYPNVKQNTLEQLFEDCDFYLDVNYENEIADAVHQAFLQNQLVVGFEETKHNALYTADTNLFSVNDYQDMIDALNATLQMPQIIDEALKKQRNSALSELVSCYENL